MWGRTWAVVLLMPLCVGCGRADPGSRPGTLPPLTGIPASSTSSTALPSASVPPAPTDADQRAVTTLYLDWSAHYLTAQDMATELRRTYLARWLVDPALRQYVDLMRTSDEQYVRVRGRRTSHVLAVTVSGSEAHLDDCTDVHRQVVRDTRTGRPVGKRLRWVSTKAALKRTGEGWRINELKTSLAPCVGRIGATP